MQEDIKSLWMPQKRLSLLQVILWCNVRLFPDAKNSGETESNKIYIVVLFSSSSIMITAQIKLSPKIIRKLDNYKGKELKHLENQLACSINKSIEEYDQKWWDTIVIQWNLDWWRMSDILAINFQDATPSKHNKKMIPKERITDNNSGDDMLETHIVTK